MKLALVIDPKDEKFVHLLKGMFSASSVKVISTPMHTLAHLRLYCKQNSIDTVFTTQVSLLKKLSNDPKASLSDYEGSMFKITRDSKTTDLDLNNLDFMEIIVLRELAMLYAIPYQRFLVARFIKKITNPSAWITPNRFSHTVIDASYTDTLLAEFSKSLFVSVDIETNKDLGIRCCGYTTVQFDSEGQVLLNNYVLPTTDLGAIHAMRKLNAHPVKKALQNGKYDSAYFYLYSAPLENYLLDSINMHHSWYSELPKDLATLAAFYVRDFRYWKGAHSSQNLAELYEYNARDTYVTALVVLSWIKEAPDWAKHNYLLEFPLVPAVHLCEMTGIKVDLPHLKFVKEFKETKIQELNLKLDKQLNVTNFNTNSPIQMKQFLKLLGISDPKSADEKTLIAVKAKHPLNALLIENVIGIRKLKKIVSTYLKDSIYIDHPMIKNKRTLYALNPHGTETGRLASKEHHFWCGMNIQNIPRGNKQTEVHTVKDIFVADDGFLIAEADFAQAESRGTGYVVGQENLIEILESELDFHKYNASSFFGVPYEKVDKPLRQLSKPVNHGANYNMGAAVLIQQMGGEVAVLKAGALLGLPPNYGAEQIAKHLLASFDRTYPKIRNDYHDWVKYKVATTKKLVGATGWTRYCFGNPSANKPDLNALVAHNPQSLNAMILNKAFLKVFYNIWYQNPKDFMILAQIHDSILFQYRIGREDLADRVKKEMVFPVDVTDINGNIRTMIVPVDINIGLKRWGDKSD